MSSAAKDEQDDGTRGDVETAGVTGGHDGTGETEDRAAGEESTTVTRAPHMSVAIDDNEFATAPPDSPAVEAEAEAEDTDEIPYPEADDEASLQPPPDFKPFFTLIEDPTTGEHHHPTVHYVFADDDPDILTRAALETLSSQAGQQAAADEVDERFVIVDMASDGKEVLSASSLSPDWQALKTKISQAPSWGNDSPTAERALMLRISGQEATAGSGVKTQRRKGDLEVMIKLLDEHLEDLDGVLGGKDTTDTQHET